MFRAAILLVAIVACAHAACIGQAFSDAYKAGTGITPIDVAADTVVSVKSLPICGGTSDFPKQADGTYSVCCSSETFNQIKQLGQEYSVALSVYDDETATFNQAKDELDKAVNQICQQLPDQCQAYKEVVAIIKDFLKVFPKHYRTCAGAYRDYLEGALCAICSPNFTPDIAIVEGAKITFTWAPATCSNIADACTPVIQDIFDFAQRFFSSSLFGSIGDSGDFDFLAGIEGANVNEKIKNFLCYYQLNGVATLDFTGIGNIAAGLSGDLSGSGLKRDDVTNIFNKHASRLRSTVRGMSVRQSPSGSANVYNGTYNPVAVGQKSSFISSATTVAISMAAFIVAMLGLFLF
jgi:hypothetical protein